MPITNRKANNAGPPSASVSDDSPETEGFTITEVPLSLPNRTRDPKHKTLLDIVDERRPRDAQGRPIDAHKKGESGVDEDGEDLVGPFAQAFFYNVPLIFLLFAFEVIVHQQYRQELDLKKITFKCLKAFPIFLTLIYQTHSYRKHALAQAALFAFSVGAGCWLVHATNRYGYYAVMRQAPPVGALWIWAAVEMNLSWLSASCVAVCGWVWYGGYHIL
ncbi:hypothetical protein DFH27DRAFT_531069 [Peziza echinospora]|nr:hypothetical protein DFH27DRAFT_531069 [Peziza echinospora]